MSAIKVLRGEDGRPYVSLEDIINEIILLNDDIDNFDTILKALYDIEKEYYNKFIFKK